MNDNPTTGELHHTCPKCGSSDCTHQGAEQIKQLREQLAAASQREAELLSQRKYLLKALKGSIGYDTWPTKKDLDFARLVITTIDEAIANE